MRAASATLSRVSCFSVVPPRSDSDTVERLNPVISAMVRSVTRDCGRVGPGGGALMFMAILDSSFRFYTEAAHRGNSQFLQRYKTALIKAETIAQEASRCVG